MMRTSLELVCAAAGLTAKWWSYVILRHMPFGKWLPTIHTALLIYLAAWAALWRLPAKGGKAGKRSVSRMAKALLLGAPDHSSVLFSALGLVGTLAGPSMMYDLIYRPDFLPEQALAYGRTGWVTDSTASIMLRSPHGPFNFSYAPAPVESSLAPPGKASSTSQHTTTVADDWTATINLERLEADTDYTWSTSSGLHGSFRTRRPSEALDRFSILSSSCQKPNFPYSPFQHPHTLAGVSHLDRWLSRQATADRPEAMLFLGDFVYSDLPLPQQAYSVPYYRQLYRQIYASPSWTGLTRSLPWIHMFDDHEIVNDYHASPTSLPLYSNGMQAYREYQQGGNPPAPGGQGQKQSTYYSFNMGKVAFFVLDNRSYRSPQPARPGSNSTAGWGERTMLGSEQLEEVRQWVDREGRREGRLLVLVSGVPVTRNWSEGSDETDSWAGYLDEREEVLRMLWAVGGAVIISGDRHEHATTLLTPPSSPPPPPPTPLSTPSSPPTPPPSPPPHDSPYPRSASVIEFSTSALSYFHHPLEREYMPHPPTDLPIHYHWSGHSKFGAFQFDTTQGQRKVLFKLVVDGEETWAYEWVKGAAVHVPTEWRAKEKGLEPLASRLYTYLSSFR